MPYKRPDGHYGQTNPATPDIPGPPMRAFTPFGQQSFDKGRLNDPNAIPPPVALDVRGKIGQTVFQKSIPPPWATWYPRVISLQRRRHVIPFDPKTILQLRCRARWAAGMEKWRGLSESEKLDLEDLGSRRDKILTALQMHMKLWCALHAPSEYATQAILWAAQPDLPFINV